MDAIRIPGDRHALIEKHSYAHVLQSWDHPDRVMVAKHAIGRFLQLLTDARHSIKRRLI